MRHAIQCICAVLVLSAFSAQTSAEDDKHNSWIVIDSVNVGAASVGQATRLDDGNYRNSEGHYLIVRDGKVAAKGQNHRQWQPARIVTRGSGDTEDIGTPAATELGASVNRTGDQPRAIRNERLLPASAGYAISECGTAASPKTCCKNEAGKGASCDAFKAQCNSAGGKARGNASEATCSTKR